VTLGRFDDSGNDQGRGRVAARLYGSSQWGNYGMTVERAYTGHQTRYQLRDGTTLRCVLVFDTQPDGGGRGGWKILLPGPDGTMDLYGARRFLRPDPGELSAWLTPIVGHDAAAELVAAVDADPPHAADWQ
jgi:hypothetical protein